VAGLRDHFHELNLHVHAHFYAHHMAVDYGSRARMPADKALALELRKTVPELRTADVQALGEHLFRRQFSGMPVGAFLHFPQEPAPYTLHLRLFAHAFAPPCHTSWYY
jgi:hypothetical protein